MIIYYLHDFLPLSSITRINVCKKITWKLSLMNNILLRAIQVLRNVIFLDSHPPPRNANNIEHYTFVTLFSRKSDPPPPHLHYVTLEWPLTIAFPLTTILDLKMGAILKQFSSISFLSSGWPCRAKIVSRNHVPPFLC